LFLTVVQDKVNPINLSQLLTGTLGIATNRHHQSLRISTACQSEQVTAFPIGDMGNSTGIEYIDISPLIRRYQPIACLSKLPG
jgi:hypothetical protein